MSVLVDNARPLQEKLEFEWTTLATNEDLSEL